MTIGATLTIFYCPGADRVRSADEIPEEAAHGPPTLTDWKNALAPILPEGAVWETERKAIWRDGERTRMELEVSDDLSYAALAMGLGAALDAMLRRMFDAKCWIVICAEVEGGFVELSKPLRI